MIYLLEFTGKVYEFKRSRGKSSIFFHELIKNRSDMMILHKYDLFFDFDSKFQTNNPDKIDFTKIKNSNVILYHLDIYSGCSVKIKSLIDYCIDNKMDLFIPVSDGIVHYFIKDDRKEYPHRYEIREILEEYEHVLYDFTDISNQSNMDIRVKNMLRDLTLRDLLG